MNPNVVDFFNIQRQIFGICPRSKDFFRLSDCKVYLKGKPARDWMDKLEDEADRLDEVEERLDKKEDILREKAREKGRQLANETIKKIDHIFRPRRLNPDDAKVMFHPVDYIVFKGMKLPPVREIRFLDREARSPAHRQVQKSIIKVVEKGNYEWLTLRVSEDGKISEE